MKKRGSAIVIGGGIIGATSAFALASDGWSVRVLDSRPGAGQGASSGNGRQLSYSHTNALASPHLLLALPRLLAGRDEAFRLSLRTDASFARWSAAFLANCTPRAFRRNTLAVLALAEESRQAMDRLLGRYPVEFQRKRAGKLVLLDSEADMRSARRVMELKRSEGLEQHLLTRAEACAIEPALEQTAHSVLGALYAPGDETGDCRAFAESLLRIGASEFGIEFSGGCEVARLERSAGRIPVHLSGGEVLCADLVVAASGADLNRLLAPIGHSQPVEAMKGYSFTAPLAPAAPLASVTDARRRLVFTHTGDRMLVAGIAEMGRPGPGVEARRLASMIDAARSSLPQAALYDQADQGWSGMRPLTPNSQPITRMLEPGLAVNGGHGMLGWTLAMGSAQRLARLARDAA